MNRLFLHGLIVFLAGQIGFEGAAAAQVAHTDEGDWAAGCDVRNARRPAHCAVEEMLLRRLQLDGVEAAMAALDSLAEIVPEVRRDGHEYAHAIGIAAYTGAEEVGSVFNRCTPAYQSGCYHGVVQSYFQQHAAQGHAAHLDPDFINGLCRAQRVDSENRWQLFQCAHGMGHGVMLVVDHHLPTALEACDLVADVWERESCYGGVFMENIVHATVPHHSTGRPHGLPQGGDAAAHDGVPDSHGGQDDHAAHGHDLHGVPGAHDHHAGGAAPLEPREAFPALDPRRPFYPCTVLPERYLGACYQMQTSAILHFNGYDVAAGSRTCLTAPPAYQATCFQSLGRDISALTLQDHRRAMRLCSTAPGAFEAWCNLGYAKNLVDVTADPTDGFAYCRVLPPGESKRFCNIAVGEEIWVLAENPERRAEMCLGAEPDYVAACRHGAGLEGLTTGALAPHRAESATLE